MSIFEGKKPRAFNRTVNLDQQWGPTDCKPATNDYNFRAIQQELAQEYRERHGDVIINDPPPGKGAPMGFLPKHKPKGGY